MTTTIGDELSRQRFRTDRRQPLNSDELMAEVERFLRDQGDALSASVSTGPRRHRLAGGSNDVVIGSPSIARERHRPPPDGAGRGHGRSSSANQPTPAVSSGCALQLAADRAAVEQQHVHAERG